MTYRKRMSKIKSLEVQKAKKINDHNAKDIMSSVLNYVANVFRIKSL